MTVGSTPCPYIELAIPITLNVALILVHYMRACVRKGAPTTTVICLVQEIRLSSSTILGAWHPSHVKRGAKLSALHACMRGQGCNDRDRHMFGTSATMARTFTASCRARIDGVADGLVGTFALRILPGRMQLKEI